MLIEKKNFLSLLIKFGSVLVLILHVDRQTIDDHIASTLALDLCCTLARDNGLVI